MRLMSPQKKFTVAVMGAAGGVGQPLSLFMKLSPYVSDLRLYDVVPAIDGVAADLSHVCTSTKVSSFYGPSDDSQATASALEACLSGVDYVLITAGTTMKPGMDTRDKLFNTNAKIIDSLVSAACDECPEAKILIITNPVNSLVPAASQVMRKKGIRDWEKKLFGSSTLDVFRAATFLAQELNTDPSELVSRVRIFGGHSGETILPIFSLISKDLSNPEKLIRKVQEAGMTVYHAKENKGTATLSMALAASRFIEKLMKAANGETVTECTFVSSQGIDGIENCRFFTLPVTFDKSGVTEMHGLPNDMSEVEKRMLKDEVIPKLKKDIEQGLEHASM